MTNEKLKLFWKGPAPLIAPNNNSFPIYERNDARTSGIYMWTVRIKERLQLNYIGIAGKSSSIRARQEEHVRNSINGNYVVYNPEPFLRGEAQQPTYTPYHGLTAFMRRYKELIPSFFEYAQMINVYFAPTDVETNILQRIESAVIRRIRHVRDLEERATKYPYFVDMLDNARLSLDVPKSERFELDISNWPPIEGLANTLYY